MFVQVYGMCEDVERGLITRKQKHPMKFHRVFLFAGYQSALNIFTHSIHLHEHPHYYLIGDHCEIDHGLLKADAPDYSRF